MKGKYMYATDDRCYPQGAAGPPVNRSWKDGDPPVKGWYAVALLDNEHIGRMYGYIYELPVIRARWTGKKWRRDKYTRLWEKYCEFPTMEDCEECPSLKPDTEIWYWKYDVEYWCELPGDGYLPRCEMNY